MTNDIMRDSQGKYINQVPLSHLIRRALWYCCRAVLFKPFPSKLFRSWRNLLLRLFGAKIHPGAHVYSTARIMNPWNLEMANLACLGPYVICENDVLVKLEENATVSQYSYLCTSSHNINDYSFDLQSEPIIIGKDAWVAADAFIGMGVKVGEGAVVGARASVYRNVPPWTVVGGNPAKIISKREKNIKVC